MSFGEWCGVVALVLALLELVFLLALVALALRTWSRVAPQLAPLLAMFAGPPASPSSSSYPPAAGGVTGGTEEELGRK